MKKLILLFLGLILISCGGGGDEDVTPVQVTPEPVVVQKFTLTVSAAEGGSVNTSGGSFTSGASVNLTATAQNGYVFSGWSGDSTSNENSISITVKWFWMYWLWFIKKIKSLKVSLSVMNIFL